MIILGVISITIGENLTCTLLLHYEIDSIVKKDFKFWDVNLGSDIWENLTCTSIETLPQTIVFENFSRQLWRAKRQIFTPTDETRALEVTFFLSTLFPQL